MKYSGILIFPVCYLKASIVEGEYWLTKKMVADFYAVDVSTIDRCLAKNSHELKHNGYVLCKGKSLKAFKLQFAHLISEASKTTQFGLFNFRAFLNIGMLLTESEKAKALRSMMLDSVIATIHEKTGEGTKFINRRDVQYLPAAIAEENCNFAIWKILMLWNPRCRVRHRVPKSRAGRFPSLLISVCSVQPPFGV